jgi:hypothetical protein
MINTVTIDYFDVTYNYSYSSASGYKDGWGTPSHTDVEIVKIFVDTNGMDDDEVEQITGELLSVNRQRLIDEIILKYH